MKNHLLLSILILYTFSLSAETIIEYHVSHWSEPELIDVKSNIPIHQVLTIGKGKFLLTKMREPQTNSEYIFYDLKNNTQIEYTWSFGNKAYSSKIRPSKNEVILIPNAGKKILGIPSEKALIVQGKDTTEVFYTTQFNVSFCPIGELPGVVLEYATISKAGKTRFAAVKVFELEVPASVYDFSEYQIVDTETMEYKKQMHKEATAKIKKRNKKIGSKAPSFKIKTIDGEKFHSKKLKGKVIVMCFWATRSSSSVKGIPSLNKLVQKYKDEPDVIFLSAAMDDANTIRTFLEEHPFEYKIKERSGNFIWNFSSYFTTTTNLIIGRDGRIKEFIEGYEMDIAVQLNEAIEEELLDSFPKPCW